MHVNQNGTWKETWVAAHRIQLKYKSIISWSNSNVVLRRQWTVIGLRHKRHHWPVRIHREGAAAEDQRQPESVDIWRIHFWAENGIVAWTYRSYHYQVHTQRVCFANKPHFFANESPIPSRTNRICKAWYTPATTALALHWWFCFVRFMSFLFGSESSLKVHRHYHNFECYVVSPCWWIMTITRHTRSRTECDSSYSVHRSAVAIQFLPMQYTEIGGKIFPNLCVDTNATLIFLFMGSMRAKTLRRCWFFL